MSKVPTAEEFFKPHRNEEGQYGFRHIESLMKEFAKLHVEAALEAAANKAVEIQKPTSRKYVSKKELKSSYLLENIN